MSEQRGREGHGRGGNRGRDQPDRARTPRDDRHGDVTGEGKQMTAELDVLRDVSGRLQGAGIPYMLTGSLAMSYYAEPRMTRDIDLVVELGRRDVERVVSLFAPDYYLSAEAVSEAIRNASMFNLVHVESVVKVDVVIRKDSAYRKHEFTRRREIEVDGFKTWVASREDLILSKLHWAKDSRSEMQLQDVRNLLATSCDWEYLHRWAGRAERGIPAGGVP